jgi:nitrile hydratase
MDGIHDTGGMHVFGPDDSEENMRDDHDEWQQRTFALVIQFSRATRTQGVMNIDAMHHAIERLRPADYLASGYFERWLKCIECLLAERGW